MTTKGTGATSIPKDGKGRDPEAEPGRPVEGTGSGTKGGPWTKPGAGK